MPTELIEDGCVASVQTSGVKGAGARAPSQNVRAYLKSAKTVKYLLQISRVNDPYRYSRSTGAGAGEEICSFFTHVVGKAEIGVAIASVKLKPTKSVDQKDVDYTRHGVGAVNGGSPVLQDVDVINQPKRKHVEIDRITGETDWR